MFILFLVESEYCVGTSEQDHANSLLRTPSRERRRIPKANRVQISLKFLSASCFFFHKLTTFSASTKQFPKNKNLVVIFWGV